RHVQDAHDRRSREALLDRLNHSWILALSGLWTYHPNVFRKGRNREAPVSLPNERKALAERYTIDAEEAEARSQRAAVNQGTGQTEEQVATLRATEIEARREAEMRAAAERAAEEHAAAQRAAEEQAAAQRAAEERAAAQRAAEERAAAQRAAEEQAAAQRA